MRNKAILTLLIILTSGINSLGQKYFISFTDKNNSPYSVSNPEAFLSTKAIERRSNQDIAIDINDIPVNTSYIDSLKNIDDVTVGNISRWLNGAIVECTNQNLIDTITRVSFIADCQIIYNTTTKSTFDKFAPILLKSNTQANDNSEAYGVAWPQTETLNAQYVHEYYNGEGIAIAVLDAGFYNVNSLPCFQHLWDNNQIAEYKDFVDPDSYFFLQHYHGMKVLSILAGYEENTFKGSAIDATYYLYRTEDTSSEYPIEEYNWICAAERADSLGVDIITSSLGYYSFDDSDLDYDYEDMDGQTTVVVKGAEMAFSRGMIVVNSAGNEGNNSWKYIITPADGTNVLTVGAMTNDSIIASFSSYGPTYDNRIKPDVVGVGVSTGLQELDGSYTTGNGTSYSTPVISGLTACIWQANPDMSNTEIINLIKANAHLYDNANNRMGYGIPDFAQCLNLKNSTNTITNKNTNFSVLTNPFSSYIRFSSQSNIQQSVTINLYNITGENVYKHTFAPDESLTIQNVNNLSKGIYIAELQYQSQTQIIKLIKQ